MSMRLLGDPARGPSLPLSGRVESGAQPVAAVQPLPKSPRALLLILLAGLAVVAVQLVPLPPSLWAHGLRARIADSYALLGQPVPWLPISLTPYSTLNSVLGVIPPVAL